jgi:hypothetical protein
VDWVLVRICGRRLFIFPRSIFYPELDGF